MPYTLKQLLLQETQSLFTFADTSLGNLLRQVSPRRIALPIFRCKNEQLRELHRLAQDLTGASPAVRWLRVLAMQGTQVRSLVRELRPHLLQSK